MELQEWMSPEEARIVTKSAFGIEHIRPEVVKRLSAEDVRYGVGTRGSAKGIERIEQVRYRAYLEMAQKIASEPKAEKLDSSNAALLSRITALEARIEKLERGIF